MISYKGKSGAEREIEWQRSILPEGIRELVVSDQKNRNEKLWSLFF
ncbi:MAG: hypothetical protein LWX23_10515 [Spirochaetia bacterium]|jgi:hypothetical protein|nr:hypothetical protein [Spirochaetia bacterium]MCE1209888.1 hypothetical protein [Spirochaetia bacterium]NLX44435.1 hypothetical protein [Treponema sp.]HOI21655.1 hypothetical protein [Spirochaetales bacterium]